MAIIGFNDDPIASIVDPSLSSITHPASDMGRISAEKILEHMQKGYKKNNPDTTILGTHLIIRNSSKKKISTLDLI